MVRPYPLSTYYEIPREYPTRDNAPGDGFLGEEYAPDVGTEAPPNRGYSAGFGQIRFTSTNTTQQLATNQRTLLTIVPDPAQTLDYRNDPFTEFDFLDDQGVLRPRLMADVYDYLLNVTVTSQVVNGSMLADIDVGNPAGPTETAFANLFYSAGQPERVTFLMRVQVLKYFLTNGARIYLTSTVPLLINSAQLLVSPISTFAAQS